MASYEDRITNMVTVNPTDTPADVPSGSMNIKELSSRLQELYIATTEFGARKELLETLVNENLTTRDIYYFIKNQAHLR